MNLCKSFDFMDEDDVLPDLDEVSKKSPPLSPKTVALRQRVLEESSILRRAEFSDNPHFDYISHFINRPLNWAKLESWVDFNNGYRYRIPGVDDRVWMMPEYGMQGVPLIMFDYGLRLHMHPFHLAMYEAFGCGIAQLVPNAVAQVAVSLPFATRKTVFLL